MPISISWRMMMISTILDAVLYIRRVQINPTIVLQHEQTLGLGITA
jgi:hypothetical protein